MKKILRAKISYQNQFETIRRKIINMITEMPDDDFVFVVDDNGDKRSVHSNTLVGQTLQIQESPVTVTVQENGVFVDEVKESLIRQSSLEQLKKVCKQSKKTDIGQKLKISKMGNLLSDKNVLDGKVDTYEEYMSKSKKN